VISGPSRIENCLVVGNSLGYFGAPIESRDAHVSHCTIVGNRSVHGSSGVHAAEVANCIVYGNRSVNSFGIIRPQVTADSLSDSIVEGTADGVSVLDLDPRFVDFGFWDDAGTPSEPSYDVFVSGDYHLLPESPCIDRGDPEFEPASGATDLDGEARVQGCRVDIGVDEFTQIGVGIGDMNGDGVVDLDDVPLFVEKSLNPSGLGICEADVNEDGRVDGRDIGAFVALQLGS
jgi:Dockerin type I domain